MSGRSIHTETTRRKFNEKLARQSERGDPFAHSDRLHAQVDALTRYTMASTRRLHTERFAALEEGKFPDPTERQFVEEVNASHTRS